MDHLHAQHSAGLQIVAGKKHTLHPDIIIKDFKK